MRSRSQEKRKEAQLLTGKNEGNKSEDKSKKPEDNTRQCEVW